MGLWERIKRWFRRDRGSEAKPVAPAVAAAAPGAKPRRAVGPPAPSPAGDPGAFVKLAERYLGMQMADTALHVCQRGLEAHPDHVGGRALLARIYVAKGMRAEAQELIEVLVAELGDAPEVATLRGLMTSGPGGASAARPSPGASPATAPPTGDTTRRELQALEGYLGRIRRELGRLGPP